MRGARQGAPRNRCRPGRSPNPTIVRGGCILPKNAGAVAEWGMEDTAPYCTSAHPQNKTSPWPSPSSQPSSPPPFSLPLRSSPLPPPTALGRHGERDNFAADSLQIYMHTHMCMCMCMHMSHAHAHVTCACTCVAISRAGRRREAAQAGRSHGGRLWKARAGDVLNSKGEMVQLPSRVQIAGVLLAPG